MFGVAGLGMARSGFGFVGTPCVSFTSGLVGIVGGKRRELKCTDPFLEK